MKLNKTSEMVLLTLRIFIVLLIIGIIMPYIMNLVLEMLPLTDTYDPPKRNSTYVISRNFRKKAFLFYFRKMTKLYFSL